MLDNELSALEKFNTSLFPSPTSDDDAALHSIQHSFAADIPVEAAGAVDASLKRKVNKKVVFDPSSVPAEHKRGKVRGRDTASKQVKRAARSTERKRVHKKVLDM